MDNSLELIGENLIAIIEDPKYLLRILLKNFRCSSSLNPCSLDNSVLVYIFKMKNCEGKVETFNYRDFKYMFNKYLFNNRWYLDAHTNKGK